MTELEGLDAHNIYVEVDRLITKIVEVSTNNLTDEQRDYVYAKLRDEYRFWRSLK